MPRNKLVMLFSLVSVILIALYLSANSGFDLAKFQNYIRNLGIFAPILFILIYTIGPIFFIPITPLSITGGALFGPWVGTVLSLIGATLGACAAFLVSRYIAKDWVDAKSHNKVIAIQGRVRKEGWKIVALARITPIFPFNLQNYIFGVTDIPLRTFLWATLISLIPGVFAYVYLGYAGRSALSGDAEMASKILVAFLILIFFSFLPLILKRVKQRQNIQKSKG